MLVAVDLDGGAGETGTTIWGHLVMMRVNRGQFSLGACSTQCMLYLVYDVLSVCCTLWMLHWVLGNDHGMERS